MEAAGDHEEGRATTHLSRSFADVRARPEDPRDVSLRRAEIADTRIGPPGAPGDRRTITIALPAAAKGERVRWEVAYQRVVLPGGERFGHNAAEDEIVIARRVLPGRGP
jgi:hypothetical protein